jgi:hypothetical protein
LEDLRDVGLDEHGCGHPAGIDRLDGRIRWARSERSIRTPDTATTTTSSVLRAAVTGRLPLLRRSGLRLIP